MSQAAERTLRLVEVVVDAGDGGLGLLEAAAATALDKSTASRLLGVARDRGWLTRDARTRRYAAGPTLVGLARRAALSDDASAAIHAILRELRDEHGETASFHRRFGAYRVAVAGAESRAPVRRAFTAGEVVPLTRGPTSRAILAFLPADERDGPADAGELTAVSDAGYVTADSERTDGVGAVSTPVFDAHGVTGAVSLAGPSGRFHAAARDHARVPLLHAAQRVTTVLGGQPSRYAPYLARLEGSR